MSRLPLTGAGPSSGLTYSQKVLTYSPIGYWPMNETSGTALDNAEGTASRDGVLARNITTMGTTTGIGDGNTAPNFDGTNDWFDVHPVNLGVDTTIGTLILWANEDGDFAGGTGKLAAITEDGGDRMQLYGNGANSFMWARTDDTVAGNFTNAGIGGAGWFFFAAKWSESGDYFRGYYNGVEVANSPLEGLGSFAAVPDDVRFGAWPTDAFAFDGGIAHVAIWDSLLSDAQILDLATV